ncbi:unnamed protein product [Cylindrotheca closterium]|uniref:Trafficking protein particle complex subunit n=1 Tax=Cylindrotheca closterium TaxID=2856 RepID=A0AAD2FIU9_9STRA|nr:unnamed protein product [Cylindrotheca closterium]
MTVHSFHIFDRRGKTLFTKRYIKNYGVHEDDEQLSEQRKLVFGMLFSLRELSSSLSPSTAEPGELKMVKTGASALYNYETVSGLRFVVYTTPETAYTTNDTAAQSPANSAKETKVSEGQTSPAVTGKIRAALKHIYEHIWVTFVIRSPMYQPSNPNISATNFEASLDSYLKEMPWFR